MRSESLEASGNWAGAAQYDVSVQAAESRGSGGVGAVGADVRPQCEDGGAERRAVDLHYEAIGALPKELPAGVSKEDAAAVRYRLGELLLETGDFKQAENEANEILRDPSLGGPRSPEAHRVRALALYGQFRLQQTTATAQTGASIGQAMETALELNPADLDLSVVLADVYRTERRLLVESRRQLNAEELARLADRVMDQMVAAKPADSKVRLARFNYRTRFQLASAEEDIKAAVENGRDNPEVLLPAGQYALAEAERVRREKGSAEDVRRRLEEARGHLQAAIKVATLPSHVERAYSFLGDTYTLEDQPEQAAKAWKEGVTKVPWESVRLNYNLARVHLQLGKLDGTESADTYLTAAEGAIHRSAAAMMSSEEKRFFDRNLQLMRTDWHRRKGEIVRAVPLLKQVTAGHRPTAGQFGQFEMAQTLEAWVRLCEAYSAMGQWDQAALGYEQIAALQPKNAKAREAAGKAWEKARQPERAAQNYEKAVALEDNAEAKLALAAAAFEREARQPPVERNWERFEQFLGELKKGEVQGKLLQPWRVGLLEANYRVARSQPGADRKQAVLQAIELLRATEKQYANSPELLKILVLAYEQGGSTADADRVLAAIEKRGDAPADACVLQSRLFAARKDYKQAKQVLQAGLSRLPANLRPAIEYEQVQVSLRKGALDQAYQQLAALSEKQPANVELLRQLADLALERGGIDGADTEVARWAQKLREKEGPNGAYAQYFEALLLTARAKSSDDPALARSMELQQAVQLPRQVWPQSQLLLGLIQERQGKIPEAIEAYEQAVRLGLRRTNIYQRLIGLLYASGRFMEVEKYLGQLSSWGALPGELEHMEISAAAAQGELDRAVALAAKRAQERPDDSNTQLWYGQILTAKGEADKAEAALRRAAELAPADSKAYAALLNLFFGRGDRDRAGRLLDELGKSSSRLPDASRELLLAQGFERLGEWEKAEKSFREAERLSPDSSTSSLRLGLFYFNRGDRSQAEASFRKVLERDPADRTAPATGCDPR